jgi:hypothetical protein
MKHMLRSCCAALALAAGLVAAPAAAQDAAGGDSPQAAAPDAVGPAQLRDFSLGGTVIRRSEQQPRPAPSTRTSETGSQRSAAETTQCPRAVEETAPGRQQPSSIGAQASNRAPSGQSAATGDAGEAVALRQASPAAPFFGQDAVPAMAGAPAPLAPALPSEDGGYSLWPLLAALLGAGGLGAWYFRRGQVRAAYAGLSGADPFVAAPQPAPEQAIPRPHRPVSPPPAAKPPSGPVGIVASGLRPSLSVRLLPGRLLLDEGGATLEFEVVVHNKGNAAARAILVEAAMLNAGPEQEQELKRFFDRPAASGEPVDQLAPLKTLTFRTSIFLARDKFRLFQAGDRTVFVPLVGVTVLYRAGDRRAQTSESFLVGKDTGAAKLAPFALEPCPRSVGELGARLIAPSLRR